MTAEFKMSHI